MEDLKDFNISFTGLKLGNHQFEFKLNNTFFEHFQYDEFENVAIKVELDFEKKPTLFNLTFHSKGIVTVHCDITNEPFDLEVEGSLALIVKFGEAYNDDNDALLIIPHNQFELDVSQLIYETIVLSLPIKRIHPKMEDGTMESEILKKLEAYKTQEETMDPRWEKLKELQSNKKE